ncbi:MAG: hypothetical protein WCP29_17505, partial [Acidobacteriota bacterium]
MNRLVALVVGAAMVGGAAFVAAQDNPAASAAGKTAPIVGVWKINKDLTDKPASDNQRGGEGGRSPVGMGGGIGGRGGGIG